MRGLSLAEPRALRARVQPSSRRRHAEERAARAAHAPDVRRRRHGRYARRARGRGRRERGARAAPESAGPDRGPARKFVTTGEEPMFRVLLSLATAALVVALLVGRVTAQGGAKLSAQ